MNVLESILGDDASEGGDEEIDAALAENDLEMPLGQLSSDIAETADEVEGGGDTFAEDDAAPNDCEVNDSDDSRISGDVNCDGGNLEAENRYFAFNVHSSDDLNAVDAESNESSFKIEPEMKMKIFNALKLSDATLFIASPKLQCFIGYALVTKSKVSIDSPGDDVENVSAADSVLPIRWGKMCCLPFKDTSKIMNAFNSEKPVSQFQDGQEVDQTAADDVLFFINDSNTEVESIDSLKKQLDAVSDLVETKNEIGDNEVSPVATDESKDAKIIENDDVSKKNSDKKKSKDKNVDTAALGKRARTDSIVSSSSTQGSEKNRPGVTKRASVSSNLPKPPRPKNMFDITAMNYEQYVDRHYAIKYEQWFQENNSNMAAGALAIPGMMPGMVPGPGGMPIPMAIAMANMAMAGAGYFGGQGPGVYGPMGGPMMMGGPHLGMGMGMQPVGPMNPMLMHSDGGMYPGMNMHHDNTMQTANHLYGDRGRSGRSAGGNSRAGRF